MNSKRLVLVSGLSGAGKTSFIGILEDLGYECLDRYPFGLLDGLLDFLFETKDPRYNNIALSINVKEFAHTIALLNFRQVNFQAIFLDAQDEIIMQRYQFTRRQHPLITNGQAKTLQQAIELERYYMQQVEQDVMRIDTSHLSQKQLKQLVEASLSLDGRVKFSVSFVSFGFKYGLPLDADVVFDVRFLPNPFWVTELRSLTGNDEAVYQYVIDHEKTQDFIKLMIDYLSFSFNNSQLEGRNHFTVAIGCTGGKHRSVSLVNYLSNHYQSAVDSLKYHRDIERP
jgi:RNase adapter protein RapZ